ncbi:hypothetical protein CR513_46431, partial [Mucuna pruriens]
MMLTCKHDRSNENPSIMGNVATLKYQARYKIDMMFDSIILDNLHHYHLNDKRAIMATVNAIPGNLPVFDGKGYEDWCVKMDAILGFQELDEIVKDGFQEPSKNASAEQKETHRENKRLDCKARVLLHQCVSANVFQKISQAATSKQAWDILQQ